MMLILVHESILSGEVAMQRMSSGGDSSGRRNADSLLEPATGVAPKRGMVLPFQPLAMSFDSVNYYVDMPAVRTLMLFQHFITRSTINDAYKDTLILTGNERARSGR